MTASAPRPTSTAGRSRTIGAQLSPAVGRGVDLPAGRAEVDAARVERVDRHRVAQHVDVAVALRQAVGERFPLVAAGAAAIDAQLALGRKMLRVALDRHDVDRLRLVRVHVDREAEIGRQVAADFVPRVAGVVAAHHVPVLLHEQHVRAATGAWRCDARSGRPRRRGREMYCDFSPRLIGFQVLPPSSVRNAPAAEMAMKIRSGLVGSSRIVCRHMPPAPGCQSLSRAVLAQARQLVPVLAAVGRAEQRGVFDAGVDRVGIGQRRLEMPDALELPRVLRAVVPLVRAGHAVVDELVAAPAPRSCRRRWSAGSSARTSRSTARRRCRFGSTGDPLR